MECRADRYVVLWVWWWWCWQKDYGREDESLPRIFIPVRVNLIKPPSWWKRFSVINLPPGSLPDCHGRCLPRHVLLQNHLKKVPGVTAGYYWPVPYKSQAPEMHRPCRSLPQSTRNQEATVPSSCSASPVSSADRAHSVLRLVNTSRAQIHCRRWVAESELGSERHNLKAQLPWISYFVVIYYDKIV